PFWLKLVLAPEPLGGAMSLLQAGLAFVGGYAVKTHCLEVPCHARISASGKTIKLSVVVHSADLVGAPCGPGLIENLRPVVGVCAGDKTKETERGDWSKEEGRWCFQEAVTLVVGPGDELSVCLSCSTRYNLYVAAVSLTTKRVGEVCFPVSQVLSRLRPEDRDAEGMVHVTPVMPFDVTQDGSVTGRVYLSFETNAPPPSQKAVDVSRCCGWGGTSMERLCLADEDDASGVGAGPPLVRHQGAAAPSAPGRSPAAAGGAPAAPAGEAPRAARRQCGAGRRAAARKGPAARAPCPSSRGGASRACPAWARGEEGKGYSPPSR
ncbi:unnamed protein product, partial [Prorocentrum cordatum]